MTDNELLTAILEFDPDPIVKLLRGLSGEDLLKFELGLQLLHAAVTRENEDREEQQPNSSRCNLESIMRLRARMLSAQTEVLWRNDDQY